MIHPLDRLQPRDTTHFFRSNKCRLDPTSIHWLDVGLLRFTFVPYWPASPRVRRAVDNTANRQTLAVRSLFICLLQFRYQLCLSTKSLAVRRRRDRWQPQRWLDGRGWDIVMAGGHP